MSENTGNRSDNSVVEFFVKNQLIITGVLAAVLILVIGYVGLKNFYLPSQDEEAQKEIFQAQYYFEQDSFNLALNGNTQFDGFIQIADEYSMTTTGNLASLYAGLSYLQLQNWDKAIQYLEKYDGEDIILGAQALGALGDAYSEKGDMKKAISYYEKAADYNENELTTPTNLFKAALAKDVQGDSKGALNDLKTIKEKYPNFTSATNMVDQHIARLEQKL